MGAELSAELAQCPVGTRAVGALYAGACLGVTALANGPYPRAPLHWICSLQNVVGRRAAWALVGSLFYRPLSSTMDLIMALSELYMAKVYLPAVERQMGSLRFLAWLLLTSVGTNGAFLLLMKVLQNQGTRHARFWGNQGLWPLVTVFLTNRAMDLPFVRMNVLGIVNVPNRWYPASLALGLSVLNGSVQYDMFSAIAYSYACRFLHLESRLLPSRRTAQKLEKDWCPALPGALQACLGGWWEPAADDSWQPPRSDRREEREERGQAPAQPPLRLFGGQGHRLGGN